jgi:hypothetical protein
MFLTFVSACSGGFGTMDRIMQSWEGATLNEVVSQWGYPSGQQEFDGRKIYHWDRNITMSLPSTTTGSVNVIGNTAYVNTMTYGGGPSNWTCQRSLEVDKNGVVVSWQWEGNNCPFADVAMGYQHWQRQAPK